MHPPQPHTPTSPPDKFQSLLASAHERFILLGLPSDVGDVYHSSVVKLVVANLPNSPAPSCAPALGRLQDHRAPPPDRGQAPLYNTYTVHETRKVAGVLLRRWRRATPWIVISLKCVLDIVILHSPSSCLVFSTGNHRIPAPRLRPQFTADHLLLRLQIR